MRLGQNILIVPSALSEMEAEIKLAGADEAGGPLIGYHESNQVVATNAGGAGREGKRGRYFVEVSGADATRYIRGLHAESEGRLYYLGEWHTHPTPPYELSSTDKRAIDELLTGNVSPLPMLVSVVLSADLKVAKAFRVTRREIATIPVLLGNASATAGATTGA